MSLHVWAQVASFHLTFSVTRLSLLAFLLNFFKLNDLFNNPDTLSGIMQ